MTGPFRTVEHIADGDPGPRGATFWRLTLACGHRVFRRKPRITVATTAARNLQPFIGGRARKPRGPLFAPKQVRCIWCGLEPAAAAPPTVEDLIASGDNIGALCQLVKDAGATMTLHGNPVDATGLREHAEARVIERIASTLVPSNSDPSLEWERIDDYRARHIPCGFVAFVGADAAIEEHQQACPGGQHGKQEQPDR